LNGTKNYQFKVMNTTLRPPFVDPTKGTITLMWSKLSLPSQPPSIGFEWVPDHIVPLVDGVARESVEQMGEMGQLFKKNATLFPKVNNEPIIITDVDTPGSGQTKISGVDPALCAPDISSSTSLPIIIPETKDEEYDNVFTPELSTIEEETNLQFVADSFSSESDTSGSGQTIGVDPALCAPDISSSKDEECDILTDEEPEADFKPGPLGNTFLTLTNVLDLFRGPHAAISVIPPGRKDGMYYIVDNRNNMDKRRKGKNTELWDDCGAWKKPSCPKGLFIKIGDKYTSVVLRNGQYCLEKKDKKKSVCSCESTT